MDSANFSIRAATDADAAAILVCLGEAFAPFEADYSHEAFQDTVLAPDTLRERMRQMFVLVATSPDGEIVGTVSYSCNDGKGHIRGMAVRPGTQGSGAAALLLAAAESRLLAAGCARITLGTTEVLKRAIRFYEEHGYSRSGKVGDFFGMRLIEFVKEM